jgi:dTDP-4-amino-4,6-dideoxygalactose transaminase
MREVNDSKRALEDLASCFRWPRLDELIVERVAAMMRQGRISYDLETFEAFEADLAKLFGVRHALCCNNGTAACFSAMKALGVGLGDTIIAPALSHWAAVLPAVQCGARVALADVLPDSYLADPLSAERLVDASTKAVVVTHLFGAPARLDEFRALCDRRGLALIEDVSHAFGATWQGRPVGSFGDLAFCSFQANKVVCGGEGGAVLTNNSELFYRAMEVGHPRRLMRAPEEWRRLAGVGCGFKFRPSALLVAIAHESLKRLDELNHVRQRACEEFRGLLARSSLFVGLGGAPRERVHFCCELILREGDAAVRDRVIAELREHGIPADRLWMHLPGLPSLEGATVGDSRCPAAEDVIQRILCLPAFTQYDPEAIRQCAGIVTDTVAKHAKLGKR